MIYHQGAAFQLGDDRFRPGARSRPKGTTMKLWQVLMTVALVFIGTGARAGQNTSTPLPPLVTLSTSGPYVYEFYCGACHGRDGRGNGPAAAALKTRPSDLTRLAAQNGGVFPRTRVEAYVTHGRNDVAAHGSSEMPVWGPAFKALDASDPQVALRIASVVDFIETIQAK
jgi:mono/diheme cytochrome c family protein